MEKIMYGVFSLTNEAFIRYFDTIEEARQYRDKYFPREVIIKAIIIE